MFNSLKYAKILEDAGLPRNQAETHIEILGDVIGEEMATKDELNKLEFSLKEDFRRLEESTKNDIRKLKVDIDAKLVHELQNLEHRMTLKLGGLMAAFLATGLTAAKILLI